MPWLKLLKYALPLLALAGIVWAVHHAIVGYGDRRAAAERLVVEAEWAADTAKRDKVDADAKEAAEKERKAQVAANVESMNETNQELARIAADNRSLSGLLRKADSEIRTLTAAQASGQRGIDVLTGIARRSAEIDRRYDEYDAACRRDAVRFTALQEQLRGQL